MTSKKQTKNRPYYMVITWFSPPLKKKQKCRKTVLNLIDKQLLKYKKLQKIFNRNSVKVRYSCTGNMKSFVTAHSKKLLPKSFHTVPPCNYRINAHWIKNARPEIFYKNTLFDLVWNQTKFTWKQLKETLTLFWLGGGKGGSKNVLPP